MASTDRLGGLRITPEMKAIMDKPIKYLRVADGGQRLRDLYREESLNFNPTRLSEFALLCYIGALGEIKKRVESKQAPNLAGVATAWRHGYATIVVLGAHRLCPDPTKPIDHEGTLDYLLKNGAPPNSEDIVGDTALHHLCECLYDKPTLVRILVMNGADPNHRNRYGCVPLLSAFQTKHLKTIETLMEFGADLDIPDADGYTARKFFSRCGPQVTAVMMKWIRKRSGEAEMPREGGQKKCGGPGCAKKGTGQDEKKPLKNCARCGVEKYCSTECQKKAWPTHKKTCVPFDSSNTVTLRPFYDREYAETSPIADLVRNKIYPERAVPVRNFRGSQIPQEFGKQIIIKVQVPIPWDRGAEVTDRSDLMVYTKKRDLACSVRWQDQVDGGKAFRRVVDVVRTKGINGTKAYFAAELKSKDELVIKVAEVLAEQPF